jgi:hypothetical protein
MLNQILKLKCPNFLFHERARGMGVNDKSRRRKFFANVYEIKTFGKNLGTLILSVLSSKEA